MKKYAYIRVSTKEQNVDRQLIALKPYDIPNKNIYCDYQSGKDFNRPGYRKMLRNINEGDLLIIKSIDRLGRNYTEILAQWQYITKKIGADILVLDMSLLDTRKGEDNLTGTFIADLVLQVLSFVSENERENIRKRQEEGIRAARLRGVEFGRPNLTKCFIKGIGAAQPHRNFLPFTSVIKLVKARKKLKIQHKMSQFVRRILNFPTVARCRCNGGKKLAVGS